MPAPIGQLPDVAPLAPLTPAPSRAEAGFANLLKEAIGQVEGLRRAADESTMKLLAGESEEVHQAALAIQRAELALALLLEVRNKVVQAYQEIMRMPI